MSQWYFEPILDSYAAVSLLALGLGLLLLAPPTFQSATVRRKRILIGLRLAVILMVVLAMLRPTRIQTSNKRQSAALIVMADASRSMQLPDSAGAGRTRWDAQVEILRQAEPILTALRENLDVKVYLFDEALREVAWNSNRLELPEKPEGQQTDLGTNLHEAIRRDLGQRVAGVVLLSDGTQTAFEPKIELHQAGRELARLDYPLYTVAFGPSGDASQFADVAIENLPEQVSVFVKNELKIKAMMRVRGYVNKQIPVSLKIEGPGGERTLEPQLLSVSEDGQLAPIEMRFTPQEPGQYKLTLRAAPQPRERVTKNNELTAFLNVLEGGIKVGYLIGGVFSGPPGEQIRLRRSLARSPDIELQHKFVYDGDADRKRWPIDIRDFLEGNLDVVLIENLDSSALGEANIEALAKLVDSGKGLMMIGGFHSFGPGGYRSTKFADVLPIEMGRFERQELGVRQKINKDLHIMEPLKMLPFRPHPVMQLSSDAQENEAIWRQLPPLLGANKFVDIKPSGQTLCVSERNDPLLISGQYGAGRVLAFAGDSTRRWWKDHADSHKRFWRQVILWLAKRDDVQRNNVWVKLPQRRYQLGARVEFTAGVRTAAGDKIENAELAAELIRIDVEGKREKLVVAAQDDDFGGRLPKLDEPGQYRIEVVATRGGERLGVARADLQLLDRDVELSNPAADPDQLARLAALTQAAGGRAIPPEQILTLLEELQRKPPEMEIAVQTKWQLASTWWDAWLFFLVFVVLLTTEWALRKKWRFV